MILPSVLSVFVLDCFVLAFMDSFSWPYVGMINFIYIVIYCALKTRNCEIMRNNKVQKRYIFPLYIYISCLSFFPKLYVHSSALYHHLSLTIDNETLLLRDHIHNILKSPAWTEFSEALHQIYLHFQHVWNFVMKLWRLNFNILCNFVMYCMDVLISTFYVTLSLIIYIFLWTSEFRHFIHV